MTLTIKLDRNWSSFQLANSAPPLSVTGSAIAPSARMPPSLLAVRPLNLVVRRRKKREREGGVGTTCGVMGNCAGDGAIDGF